MNTHVISVVSVVNLSSDAEDRLKIYRDNFESAYLTATRSFYKGQASQYLAENGVRNYMNYVSRPVTWWHRFIADWYVVR